MLDTLACIKLIQQQAQGQQSRYAEQKDAAYLVWQKIISEPELQEQLLQKRIVGFSIPINKNFTESFVPQSYSVCGIDGSQVYPDRHEGFSEYLLNIGTAYFAYDHVSQAKLASVPFVFSGLENGVMITPELVNAQRTEYELKRMAEIAALDNKTIVLCDGALIFWHLQTPKLQERFLPSYLSSLQAVKDAGALYAGYISASHSRELVALLEVASELAGSRQVFDYLVDTDIAQFFLEPGQYTQLFTMEYAIGDLYPAPLKPHFLYMHSGSEIARVEVPAYCSEEQVAYIVSLLFDQVKKGNGYPICLSEAHEQAVVKAADRDFFYSMLQRHYQQQDTVSLKLSKKRSAAV